MISHSDLDAMIEFKDISTGKLMKHALALHKKFEDDPLAGIYEIDGKLLSREHLTIKLVKFKKAIKARQIMHSHTQKHWR